MSKSKYEFWLSWQQGKEKMRLPVLPASLDIGSPSQNESIKISNLGEVTIIQDPAAKTFSFSAFFPIQSGPYTEFSVISLPWVYVKKLEEWRDTKKPIRFMVTGTPINYAVSIEDFSYREGENDIGDIDYDISLKEYKFVAPRKIDTSKKNPPTTTKRPDPKVKPKTYIVKKGDTLWAIAKREYKNSLEWQKIWNANKDMLIKRDKRNIKQPGHWIFPNQVLVLP
ncbi:LysM peptidoglycan-binding domain-containing protein [Peribacillus loiseleuriae]|uniref:LysM peptidoglycan-binding domain-containing protein n=1 Tax=Peribacillus loiseleuriae TaxID=1679170 RepID=UPI003D00ADAA